MGILFSNILGAIAQILRLLLDMYFWIVVIAAAITWIRPDPHNPIVRILRALTEPVFYRVRKWLPFTYAGGFDFSPIVVIVCIWLANSIVVKTLAEYAARV